MPPREGGKPLQVWRITSARHAERAFDGEGARLYGGRWNHSGTPLVYTSQALSLCALEYFVHLEPELAPKDLVAIRAEIPADLQIGSMEVSDLPPDWRTYPAPDSLKDLGTAWVQDGDTAALSVPSAVIPHERNILLNPAHPEFGRIRIHPAEPFAFDPRMWKPPEPLAEDARDMMAPMETTEMAIDLSELVRDAGPEPGSRVSEMAKGLVGSEILRIAGEIRALKSEGRYICDLTVGDFDPRYFQVPASLAAGIQSALENGETNYPPSSGIMALRQAVARFYERDLGLRYPIDSVLIAGGARPVIYCIFRTLCDPGDKVIYPVPSWNNNHYVHMVGDLGLPVVCGPEQRFLPTRETLAPVLPGARLLCLNSPLNPSGTAFERGALLAICEAVLEENEARSRRGERPLYLMYDHIYWMLCFGDTRHYTPVELLPEMARYTLFVDGISKAFAATGLRVGWGIGPVDVMARMSAVLGHIGAWAPRAEQVATVKLLDDPEGIREYQAELKRGIQARLDRLHQGFQGMKERGLPVESIPPMGAIYLTARIHPPKLRTNSEIRRFVLEKAGIGVVPFQAFGSTEDEGWFRLSVGAVSLEEIDAALPRLEAALSGLV